MVEHDFLTILRGYWMDNHPPEPPYFWPDDDLPVTLTEGYLRTTIRPEGNGRRGIGRTREQAAGLIMVEVFSPKSGGPGPGEQFATAVAGVWRAFRHERIQLDAPSVVGLTADGAFNRHLVTLGWRGDMRFDA